MAVRLKPPINSIPDPGHWMMRAKLWLPFWEGSGDPYDISGNGNHGTRVGAAGANNKPQWGPGKSGWSLNFDATDDYVNVPDHETLDFEKTDAFSVSVSARFKSSGVANPYLSKSADSEVGAGFWLNNNASDTIVFCLVDSSGNRLRVGTSAAFSDPKWRHIVVTYDGSNTPGGLRIYVSGVSADLDTINDDLTGSIVNDEPLVFGLRRRSAGDQYTDGQIDDPRIFDWALSEAEIWELYTNPWAPFDEDEDDPAMWLSFEQEKSRSGANMMMGVGM